MPGTESTFKPPLMVVPRGDQTLSEAERIRLQKDLERIMERGSPIVMSNGMDYYQLINGRWDKVGNDRFDEIARDLREVSRVLALSEMKDGEVRFNEAWQRLAKIGIDPGAVMAAIEGWEPAPEATNQAHVCGSVVTYTKSSDP